MLSPIEIFCCYSHQDRPLLQRLKNHLMLLQRQGLITIWSDVDINAGVEWEQEINKHLEAAQIVLLLVSADFMASDYCYSKEMQRSMQRHERKEARVIPILLRQTYWKGAPFEKLQFLPTKAKPVMDRSWTEDEALFDVVENISTIVYELRLARVLNEANMLAHEQRYEEALILYEQAIILEPACAPAHRSKGEALLHLGQDVESLAAFDQALQADTSIDDAQFYSSKADALTHLQRYEESLAAYEEALHRSPNNIDLHEKKAIILLRLKRSQEALQAYEHLIRLEPNQAEHYQLKGDLLLEMSHPDEALAAYQQAILLAPHIADYYDKQGKVLLGLKRYKDALATYEVALRLTPQNAAYSQAKGLALYALQKYEEALLAYETAIQLGTPDPYCYYEKGQALFGLERYEGAVLAYQQALDHSAPNPDPQFYHMQAKAHEQIAQ